MTKKKTAQSTKAPTDDAAAFAAQFFTQWQDQWQNLLKTQMPSPEALGLPPGFIPLQQMGPMGLMAPMGAVAIANLKLLQDLQERVAKLERTGNTSPVKKSPRRNVKKKAAKG